MSKSHGCTKRIPGVLLAEKIQIINFVVVYAIFQRYLVVKCNNISGTDLKVLHLHQSRSPIVKSPKNLFRCIPPPQRQHDMTVRRADNLLTLSESQRRGGVGSVGGVGNLMISSGSGKASDTGGVGLMCDNGSS
jgi:hypothetical protein